MKELIYHSAPVSKACALQARWFGQRAWVHSRFQIDDEPLPSLPPSATPGLYYLAISATSLVLHDCIHACDQDKTFTCTHLERAMVHLLEVFSKRLNGFTARYRPRIDAATKLLDRRQ